MTQLKGNYIGGQWVGARSQRVFERYNPAKTHELVSVAPDSGENDVAEAVEYVSGNYQEWAEKAPESRAAILMRAADILAAGADSLAIELVREEGKTLAEARLETSRTPLNLRFFAGEALRLTGEIYPTGDGSLVFTVRQPVGVVAAITPWNFPLNIPSRKLGPALAAGNGVVFKPSEVTPLMGQRLVEALLEAGVPGGALALVHGHGDVGRAMVTHPKVRAVTFTGSTSVGEAIHRAVRTSVRCQLEMGGKNALVVLDDSDLSKAATIIAKGAFSLSGQACTGTSRVVAHESVAGKLLELVLQQVAALVIGNGLDVGVTTGPLATKAQLDKYHKYLEIGRVDGAVLDTPILDGDVEGGFFARPAVFTSVRPSARIAQEEIFSPILVFLTVASYDEAVEVVNSTEFGLSAGIVTRDIATAIRFIHDADAGVIKVNQSTSGMAMNVPFGGMRNSSTQTFKEQAGASMMQFYTQDKTAYLAV
jgi:acyl-CoA reductase-like NAD-dependent aldehyde dehydrogenase